jgi:hypothetical protein
MTREVEVATTVGQPACLGVRLQSGSYDQIFLSCLTVKGFLMLVVTLSYERMGL